MKYTYAVNREYLYVLGHPGLYWEDLFEGVNAH